MQHVVVAELANHRIVRIGDGDRLAVTFDFSNAEATPIELRKPWGAEFLLSRGWSVLGVMVRHTDWYRSPDLAVALGRLRDEGFFARRRSVCFAGGSMGGFAAGAFASLAPGATVIAFNPQFTLDPRLAPWETRFAQGRMQDWSGPFADAREGIRAAGAAFVLYDPFEPLDAAHARRLAVASARLLRCPMLGHSLPVKLRELGLLKQTMDMLLAGDGRGFPALIRRRREHPSYLLNAVRRLGEAGRWRAAAELAARSFTEKRDRRFIALAVAALAAAGRVGIAFDIAAAAPAQAAARLARLAAKAPDAVGLTRRRIRRSVPPASRSAIAGPDA